MMSLLLGRRQKQMTVEAHSQFWNSFPIVCVCVCLHERGGRDGEDKCYWSYHGDSILEAPPPHTHTSPPPPPLPSASLTLISSLGQKSKYFWEEFPRLRGAAAGFHHLIWARFGWTRLPPGIPAQICILLADLLSTEVTRNNVNFWNFKYFVNIFLFIFSSQAGNH